MNENEIVMVLGFLAGAISVVVPTLVIWLVADYVRREK